MRNKISLLGFLGLLGLLGIPTGNFGFYGFYGFFGFFAFAKVLQDEMFKLNVNKAAKNAFFTGLVLYPIIVAAGALSSLHIIFSIGYAVSFAVQILVFVILLSRYESKGEIS